MHTHHEAIRRVMLSINKIDGLYYLLAKRMGVNENTLAFLYALADGQPHSQKAISDEWLIPRTTINTIVRGMLADGYIVFSDQPHAKEKRLVLTERGQRYAGALITEVCAAEERAMAGTLRRFPPEFIAALEDFGSRLHDELDHISPRKKESPIHESD